MHIYSTSQQGISSAYEQQGLVLPGTCVEARHKCLGQSEPLNFLLCLFNDANCPRGSTKQLRPCFCPSSALGWLLWDSSLYHPKGCSAHTLSVCQKALSIPHVPPGIVPLCSGRCLNGMIWSYRLKLHNTPLRYRSVALPVVR